ncbi:MAG: SH3 domain-containing protein [Casimicrobium sp.]
MKFSRLFTIPAVAASALLLASAASAQQAVTVKDVNLRAGPDRGYPLVSWIPGGASVYVNGCLNDYRWCDVTAGYDRGWVYAQNLQYIYQGQPMTIYGNGQSLALPIVSFILGSYWNDNYRNRPFYRNQNQWNGFRPGNRQPNYQPPYQPPRQPIYRPQQPRPPIQIQPQRPPGQQTPPGVVRPQQPRPPAVKPQRDNLPPGLGRPKPPELGGAAG